RLKLDLPGLGKGTEYILLAKNPFADGKDYFSQIVYAPGMFSFLIKKGQSEEPDLSPPTVVIYSPDSLAKVASGGLVINGSADDDGLVKEVWL
ncbi:hypothetical protein, partial [Vibrio cholerae]|uniref:hypothetical protein n=1 Tax=Vibrio cholerae TaxID=666 RepID=UPI00301E24ED